VAQRYDLKLYGSKPQALAASSPLHQCFQGEVWGTDMYQVLRRSRVTLNSHIDVAGREAGNMRLFEATGVGAFLLTDYKDNLPALFAPGAEVAVWHSVSDSISAIEHGLSHDAERVAVARAGQTRTMGQHTYGHRTAEILQLAQS
jgi:spore maturation protein CgeB